MTQNRKRWLPAAAVGVILIAAAFFLLKKDVWTFLTWWLMALVMGLFAMPVTGRLFRHFEDRGWVFSKVLAIAVTGFVTWFLVTVGILRFTMATCIAVTGLFALGGVLLFRRQQKKGVDCFPAGRESLIVWEELLFFGVFLMWTYLAGFHPNAYGTEKFMDYGFMEAMMRSEVLPATDLWYSQKPINYYYGGQYFAVFLTKLTGTKVEVTYNLMRMLVAAFAYVLPFSLVFQMIRDRQESQKTSKRGWLATVSGLTAGAAVSIAGNMHYVIYAQIRPLIQKWTGQEVGGYWFPDATRYIGHNPDRPDKTIHEFPCYSFVLGDLHAHVVNIMFVLLLLGILYTWMSGERKKPKPEPTGWKFWIREFCKPQIFLASFLLGMYRWTNFWDFVIYFVVTGGVVLFTNIVRFSGKPKRVLLSTLLHALEMAAVSTVVILPFTLQFDTMVQGVALAKYHSYFYQLLVLWALPTLVTILLIFSMLWESLHIRKVRGIASVMEDLSVPDLFALVTGLCAIGLIIIPEIVYVRDIYENGNARANTMFKLTYQAYIMFGLTIGYGMWRLLLITRQKLLKVLAAICLFFWVWTLGYFGNSVNAWFGQVWKPANYQGLYALNFLQTDFSEDANAIYWLKQNIKDSPVVLEANGDSYSGFERVSATTGLPTVLGWYVHEWLWRNDVPDLNQKSADIETIYTSTDEQTTRSLLAQYDVSYIFVGAKEREKYGENLNTELLEKMGAVVYRDENSGTFIVKR